jgi:recA bacterial DNA recombination protein
MQLRALLTLPRGKSTISKANKKRKQAAFVFGDRQPVPSFRFEVFMSSLLVCAQPATGHAFVPRDAPALLLKCLATVPRLSRVTQASHLEVRPAPEQVSCGIAEIDSLTGGLPRGCLTEIYGPASSGRTGLLLATITAATRRQEACALVDVSDTFDPNSAAASSMIFQNLLWIRCQSQFPKSNRKFTRTGAGHAATKRPPMKRSNAMEGNWALEETSKPEFARLEQALKITDLLLQSGGFGLVAIDIGDISLQAARHIPLTSWFRFRRAVENTPTILLVIGQGPCARTCASLLLQLEAAGHCINRAQSAPTHTQLLNGLSIHAEVVRSRMNRKPAQSVSTKFESQALWAG